MVAMVASFFFVFFLWGMCESEFGPNLPPKGFGDSQPRERPHKSEEKARAPL